MPMTLKLMYKFALSIADLQNSNSTILKDSKAQKQES